MSLITMGRQIALYHPDIHRWVMSNPASYRDQGFNERLYAILNGIDTPPVYSDNGQLRAFVNFNKGYRKDREPIVVKEIIPRGPTPRELEKKRLIALANLVGSNCSTHGSKVGKFINRNRRMNAYLYELPAEEEGISFLTCPVLGIRTLNIKKLYVSGVLLMSMDEFKERFPNAPLTCQAHAKNIAKGVNEEIAPGVTKHAAAVVKATVTRAAIGDDGLSINAKKGIKTRNTHMQRDENGLNGYQRLAKYRNETIMDNGRSVQQNALRKRLVTVGRTQQASKVSKKALAPVIEYLDTHSIEYYFDNKEYGLHLDDEHFFYDLVVPAANLCVEFQGTKWHPGPSATPEWTQLFTGKTYQEVVEYDERKAMLLLQERGFDTINVYEEAVDLEPIMKRLVVLVEGR